MKILVLLVVVASLASGKKVERYNKHSELLKPETNSIDHGPNTHKAGHLLGYKGEHWAMLKKNKKNSHKKKATHSLDGSNKDNSDDIRLQDLSYVSNNQHSDSHYAYIKERKAKKEKYLKKLEHYKAKMMGKKKSRKDHKEKAHHKKTHDKSKHSKLP